MSALKSSRVLSNKGSAAFRAAQFKGLPNLIPGDNRGSVNAPASSRRRAHMVRFWFAASVKGVFSFLSMLLGSAP